jgi:signal transduction histidine kinase
VREINLNQLLVEELNFLNADLVFKHRIHKEYKFDPSLPIVRGVYSDFSQALLNIIKNALDAMYDVPNKRLSVKTETASAGDVLIQVGDSGCGIPEEHLPQIFDPFFTTKPASVNRDEAQPTGTGLGLSSAYQLLKKYNARIEVDSKIGQGTTFNIYIPASATKIEMDVSSLLAEHQAELVEV